MRNSVVTALAVFGLAACGGGGGDENNFDLSTKAGIIDAASVVTGATAFVLGDGGDDTNTAKSRPASVRPKLAAQARASRLTPMSAKSATPKATSTEPCESGSTSYEDGSKNFSFDLFDSQSRAVDFFRITENNCKFTYDGTTETYTGSTEFGGTSSEEFGYFLFGAGSTPSGYTYTDSDSSVSESLLGQGQFRETETLADVRTVATFKITSSVGSDRYSFTADIGKKGSPLRVSVDTNDLVAINGPVAIESSECPGGEVSLSTSQPLRFTSDEQDNAYATSGSVTVRSGSSSVTFTYNGDGSATYQASNGSNGVLTRSELIDGGC